MDCAIEIVSVGGANVEMQLALQLGAERFPIALQDGVEIVMLAPVIGDGVIDYSGALIENFFWITVGSRGAEDGLPDVPLFAGAAVRSEN